MFLAENFGARLYPNVYYNINNEKIKMNIPKSQQSEHYFQEIRKLEKIYSEPIPPGERTFTVMNYNVLAQDLITGHPYLYMNHCKNNLEWDSRKRLLLNEILTIKPDILTMQEVQSTHISSFYNKLENYGYKGVFKQRTGKNQTDGCATYYRTSVFELLHSTSVEYDQPGVDYLTKPNVGLILRLKFKGESTEVIVANTHLLYNPKRWDVRLAQTQVLLAELHRISRMSKNLTPALVLVGDFNSKPDSPIVHLISKGHVNVDKVLLPPSLGILDNCTHAGACKLYNRDHSSNYLELVDKKTNKRKFSASILDIDPIDESLPDGTSLLTTPTDIIKPINFDKNQKTSFTLKHVFNFSSAYDLESKINETATTYHNKWVIVDYIFFSNLRIISRISLPTVHECSNFIGRIPNHKLPSDHLPLIATFSTL